MADSNDIPVEVWLPVVGYEGFFSVSNLGRIRRDYCEAKSNRSGCILKTGPAKKVGYLTVMLSLPGKRCWQFVHRLVLLAFVGPPECGQQCRHLDGNRQNNHLENLRWGTSLENSNDRRLHGTIPMGEKVKLAKLTEDDVREIRRLKSLGWMRKSIAEKYGVTGESIRNVLIGYTWKHVK